MARSAQDIYNTANTQRTPEEWADYYASGRNQPMPNLGDGEQLPSLSNLTASGLDMNLMNQMNTPLQTEATAPTEPTIKEDVATNEPIIPQETKDSIPTVTDITSLEGALSVINMGKMATPSVKFPEWKPQELSQETIDAPLVSMGILKSQGQR